MPRKYFDMELNDLNKRMTDMGDAINSRIEKCIQALRTGNWSLPRRSHSATADIDRMEHENEKMCMNLIASQQPIASDLRSIAACLKILTDMEREGRPVRGYL